VKSLYPLRSTLRTISGKSKNSEITASIEIRVSISYDGVGYPKFPDSWIPERDVNKELVSDYKAKLSADDDENASLSPKLPKPPGKGGVQDARRDWLGQNIR